MSDVLFVAPDLHGGVGRCVAFIADGLPQQGVDSALFLLRSRNREYPIANPKVARALPIIESPAKLRMMLPVAFIRLLRYIRQEKPAIVCSHGLLCNMLVVLARKVLRADFKTVAFEHSSPAIHYGASRMRRLKCWLVSQTYRRHDAVVGVSRGVKEDLVSMFPPLRGKVHTIYNGLPLDDVRQQSAHGAKQSDEQAPYHVVAVGRLEAVKDYSTLVDAAALLDDPGIAFTILGEGSEHAALQQRIDNHGSRTKVTLAGHIDNPFPIIASAGAFALTSVRESFGNVLVEALCLGVPVISTDCPHGPAEILDAGRYGLLVPVGNAAALAAAVRRLADDRDLRQQLSEQGPERANVFSLERHCRNVIELFRPMMQRAAGPEQDNTMQKIPVSVVVMTKNEERNIVKCLKALTDFDEVFVVDSNSTDATCAIATSLGAKVSNFQWNGKYPKKKQWCLEQLPFTHEVVLYVDADEEMTPGLADEIRAALPRFASGAGGAFIPFDYVFCGKKLEHGHRVYKLALLARDRSRFLDYDDLDVAHMWEVEGHYQPQVDGETFALRQRMVHNDHDSLFHYFDKHNRYSDWEANLRTKGLMNDPREANVGARALIKRMFQAMPFKSPIAFLHSYVFRLGFLDGKAGYDYAVARAMYYWQIRIKTEEIQKARQAEAAEPSDDTVAGAAK